MAQHKWHKEIKAWADGAEIEKRIIGYHPEGYYWVKEDNPDWNNDDKYRIKPEPMVLIIEDKALADELKSKISKLRRYQVDSIGCTPIRHRIDELLCEAWKLVNDGITIENSEHSN
jgi:hypothetical protein